MCQGSPGDTQPDKVHWGGGLDFMPARCGSAAAHLTYLNGRPS